MKKAITREEARLLEGKSLQGRIISYSPVKGYGFARTELDKDIFISSYQFVNQKDEKRAFVGSKISFSIGYYGEKVIATDVVVEESIPDGLDVLTLPNGIKLKIQDIEKIGVANVLTLPDKLDGLRRAEYVPEDPLSEGYQKPDYRILFVETKNAEVYNFFGMKSRFHGNGNIDINAVYGEYCEKLFSV